MDQGNQELWNYTLAVHEGRILDILTSKEASEKYSVKNDIRLQNHALIPGLINSHTHSAMNLMRGIADDLPLMDWLNNHIWPTEHKHVSADFVYEGSLLAGAEMLKSGTTCFNDMYFFPEETLRAVEKSGIRAKLGLIAIEFPSAWAQNADEYLEKGIALHDQLHNNSLVSTAFAPHAPYTVADETFTKIATYAEELDIPIHMHIHETADEITQSIEKYGKRPLSRLDDLGLLSPRLLAVHMTQLNNEEIQRVAETGTHVIHCPESNLKLASGFCPAHQLQQAGINLSLGTDSVASNNDLDMFGEMRTAALLGKGVAQDATALPAEQILRMATIDAAKALGLDHEIGSLEVGKSADIVAIDLSSIETQPVYDPISHLVYSAGRDKVSDVWVAGQHLVKDGELTTLDENDLVEIAQSWQKRIRPN